MHSVIICADANMYIPIMYVMCLSIYARIAIGKKNSSILYPPTPGTLQGSAAWAVALNPAVPCYAEGQAICGFSHREVPPMPPTPEIGAG